MNKLTGQVILIGLGALMIYAGHPVAGGFIILIGTIG